MKSRLTVKLIKYLSKTMNSIIANAGIAAKE